VEFDFLIYLNLSRQITKESMFTRIKSAYFNALQQNFLNKNMFKSINFYQLGFFSQKKNFCNALKCALLTRKTVVFFVTCLAEKWQYS